MNRLKYGFILVGLMLAVLPNVSLAAVAPFCGPGQAPHYQFGFQALSDNLGAAMGQPTECEHANAANGDTLQHTTKGLAFYRFSTNTPTFTNGYEHFALTSIGPVRWTGDSIDPPASALANHAADLAFLNALVPAINEGKQIENKIKDVMGNFGNYVYDASTTDLLLSVGLTEWSMFENDLHAIQPTPKYLKAYNLFNNGVMLWGRSIQEFQIGLETNDPAHINRATTLLNDAQANYDLFEREMSQIQPG